MSPLLWQQHMNLVLTSFSDKFTQAVEIEPTNHVLYSNRSGAYASMKDFDKALEDANKTIEIKPDWAKGWGRKGSALHGQGNLGMCHRRASRFALGWHLGAIKC